MAVFLFLTKEISQPGERSKSEFLWSPYVCHMTHLGRFASITSCGRDRISLTMAKARGTRTTSSSFTTFDLTSLCSSSLLVCKKGWDIQTPRTTKAWTRQWLTPGLGTCYTELSWPLTLHLKDSYSVRYPALFLHLIPWDSLTLNLEVGWQPASFRHAPISAHAHHPHSTGVSYGHVALPFPGVYVDARGTWTQIFMLAQKALWLCLFLLKLANSAAAMRNMSCVLMELYWLNTKQKISCSLAITHGS